MEMYRNSSLWMVYSLVMKSEYALVRRYRSLSSAVSYPSREWVNRLTRVGRGEMVGSSWSEGLPSCEGIGEASWWFFGGVPAPPILCCPTSRWNPLNACNTSFAWWVKWKRSTFCGRTSTSRWRAKCREPVCGRGRRLSMGISDDSPFWRIQRSLSWYGEKMWGL